MLRPGQIQNLPNLKLKAFFDDQILKITCFAKGIGSGRFSILNLLKSRLKTVLEINQIELQFFENVLPCQNLFALYTAPALGANTVAQYFTMVEKIKSKL